VTATTSQRRTAEIAEAERILFAHYGIPAGDEAKAARDALHGFGTLSLSRGKRQTGESGRGEFESSVPGSIPGEYHAAIGHLRAICTCDCAGVATSGLLLRYEARIERTHVPEKVGGISTKPDTLGDEPATVLRKRTRRVGAEHLMAHLERKVAGE
jgi:hypothetical protein